MPISLPAQFPFPFSDADKALIREIENHVGPVLTKRGTTKSVEVKNSSIGNSNVLAAETTLVDKPKLENKTLGQQLAEGQKYLSVYEVAARFSVGSATIWNWAKTNRNFPKPIKISAGTTRWRLDDIVEFELAVEGRGLT